MLRLLKLGANATSIETPTGSVLFSYETVAAVKEGGKFFTQAGELTTATAAHIDRFVGNSKDEWQEGSIELQTRAKRILGA